MARNILRNIFFQRPHSSEYDRTDCFNLPTIFAFERRAFLEVF